MQTKYEHLDSIICGDSLEVLATLPKNLVAVTVTSPPYNLDIDYGTYSDDMPYEKYLEWLKSIFEEVYRVTRPGGRLVINIDAMTNRQHDKEGEYVRAIYPHLYMIMKEIGWRFMAEICWYKQNAVGRKTAWGSYKSCSHPVIRRNHEYLLVWSKDTWRLEPASDLKSDITAEEFQEYTLSTWHVQPETRNLGGHPVPFPREIPRRVIKLFSYPDDVILDPFNGVGTTTYIAKMLGRSYIGIDIDPDYCQYAKDRIATRGQDMFAND